MFLPFYHEIHHHEQPPFVQPPLRKSTENVLGTFSKDRSQANQRDPKKWSQTFHQGRYLGDLFFLRSNLRVANDGVDVWILGSLGFLFFRWLFYGFDHGKSSWKPPLVCFTCSKHLLSKSKVHVPPKIEGSFEPTTIFDAGREPKNNIFRSNKIRFFPKENDTRFLLYFNWSYRLVQNSYETLLNKAVVWN